MATEYRLINKFKNATGGNITHNWKYVKSSPNRTDCKALIEGEVTNGSIYKDVPVTVVSCTLEQTTTTNINISE